jgi:Tfp pilus assembly protein PilO
MNNSFVDQLNLTPQERRIVVVIAAVVFVVLNYLLVWPHFHDLAQVKRQLQETRETMLKWDKEILKDVDPSTNGYKKQLSILQRQQGGGIGSQQIQLQKTVWDQATKTGVNVGEVKAVSLGHPETNEFYEEQSVKISFESMEAQLINFLFNVGNDPAMIRVRELNLRTADANRYRLKGDAILSANYAKQQPKAVAPPPAKTPVVAPKPVPAAKTIPAATPPPNPKSAPGAQSARKNL